MRRRVGLVACGAALVACGACGLDLVGTAPPASVESGDASAPPSGEIVGDAGDLPPEDSDPTEETPIADAGLLEAGPCGPAALSDNFATDLSKWTSYGAVQRQVSGNNAYAQLVPAVSGRVGGLFWVPAVKAKAFTARFSYFARTPPRNETYVGDGLTLTWLTAKDGAPLGAKAVTGQGLGLQPGVSGYAFALDAWRNLSIGDPEAPSFNILALDATRGNPGSYDWHVGKNGPWGNVYGRWHEVVVTVGGGKASVKVATTQMFTDTPIDTSKDIVAIGFTAATGGAEPIAFYVDTVTITLSDVTCD